MSIPQLYMYDLKTFEYTGSRDATQRPKGEYVLDATGATPVAPPADIPAGYAAYWTGEAWETVEDHRQRMDERGRKEGGTPYWLSEDTWRSEPRYVEELGPLPAGRCWSARSVRSVNCGPKKSEKSNQDTVLFFRRSSLSRALRRPLRSSLRTPCL